MNQPLLDKIAAAVLYEGYLLYPYRPCVKTRCRWNFGGIFPQNYVRSHDTGDADAMQTQCLLRATADALLDTQARFLHLQTRCQADAPAWQEAVERRIMINPTRLENLLQRPLRHDFAFADCQSDQTAPGVAHVVRRQHAINGCMELSADQLREDLFMLTARISNLTPLTPDCQCRDDALLRSFASTHLILSTGGGSFISATDPPAALGPLGERCRNVGCWPVLIGEPGQTDTLLASPIILEDYPQIAPQSPGDLFDGTEIDEILTLRIMTLTDEEKKQASAADPRARDLLERTDMLSRDQMMQMHGILRASRPVLETPHG